VLFPCVIGPKGQRIKGLYTGSLFDGGLFSTNFDSMTLPRLMAISPAVRLIQHVFLVPLDIQKLSVKYIRSFGLMRHQVDHAVD
jgi:sulfite exporter TauE/SafE